MKTYDRVKEILLSDPASRNSDKRLMYIVWNQQGVDLTSGKEWMEVAAHPKSIIEARRNLQRDQEKKVNDGEVIPENEVLMADKKYKLYRTRIDLQKGTHIFREDDGQGQLIE